tara:strand:- start:2046 stop:2858 length:813 start_codon:yes stop_codon:yes gene_type:complete
LSGFVRDAESVMERQQHQEGLSLARETSADFRRGEEARQQAEAYYTEASTYTASADDRMGRGGSINANEVAAFETFLVSHLSNLNGRTVSTREAQEYWVDLSSSDMGRAEQRAVQSGFFESRLRPESFGAPNGFSQPEGRAYAPIGSFSGEAAQSAAFESAAFDRNIRFDERTTPVETPTSAAVDGRFTDMIGQQREVQEYVRGSGDDVAHQTAITNGEAHVQRYGLDSYVDWAGGEENARAVMGDERFEELVRVEAEKAEEDRRLRSVR